MLEETMNDTEYEIEYSKDKDAKVGHKTADTSFFGYKTHIAMTEERIITAATITSGEKTDGKNRHLDHTGQVSDVICGADISVAETVQAMKQTKAAGNRIETQLPLFLPGNDKRNQGQENQNDQPNVTGRSCSIIFCPECQRVQTRLYRKEDCDQEQRHSGPFS